MKAAVMQEQGLGLKKALIIAGGNQMAEDRKVYSIKEDNLGFKKFTQDDKPMTEGPFYATPMVPAVHHTMGGIQINSAAQVLDKNGQVIPGLFAAGEVTGGVHGSNRVGGNGIADAFFDYAMPLMGGDFLEYALLRK